MSAGARILVALLAAVLGGEARAQKAETGADLGSCYRCHVGLGGDLAKPAEAFPGDIHAQPGLRCPACHGGDASATDPAVAMDPARGFRGVPRRADIPKFCGTCHANAVFIKRYLPNLPTDQLSQYETSVHAKQLAKGNARAAVCTSCHGVHGILPVHDPRSPVYPTHVVDTCARCHAKPDGSGPPGRYRQSVHAAALAAGDLSAPTCPRCHGAHGATPPGVQSVANVCGQCHPANMDLYRASPHASAFEAMQLGGCVTCHRHHDVVRPDDDWVGLGKGAVCAACHAATDGGGKAATSIHTALVDAARLLGEAQTRTEEARARGMLMIEAQVDLQGARQQLIQARTLVHGAEPGPVLQQASASDAASRKALAEAKRAFGEIRHRREGLLVALALIIVAIVALVLKIRQLDAARRSSR